MSSLTSSPSPSEAAREAPALRLQFIASLNHEIRTPLSGILGMADLLLETQLDDEQRDYVSMARQCADSLFELLNDTLEYTSLASGCVRLDEAEFHLEDTLGPAVVELNARAAGKGLRLAQRLAQELPRTVVGDAYRVRQLLLLLIRHAIRTTERGDLIVEASSGPPRDRSLLLSLSVTSMEGGTTADAVRDALKVFDEIEAGATRRFNGVGLGIALTRRVVELLGGDLVIDSLPSGANRITAEVPLLLPKPVQSSAGARNGAHKSSLQRILVVEDNRISQQVLSAMLAKGEHGFDCVSDGLAALAAAASQPYHLILMDLQMPGIDGIETTERIRALPGYHETPILALTADVSDQVRTLCRQKGMAAFLNKPIQASELLAAVNRYLPN